MGRFGSAIGLPKKVLSVQLALAEKNGRQARYEANHKGVMMSEIQVKDIAYLPLVI